MFETCTGKITCGNVGDSRAIIGSQRNGSNFIKFIGSLECITTESGS